LFQSDIPPVLSALQPIYSSFFKDMTATLKLACKVQNHISCYGIAEHDGAQEQLPALTGCCSKPPQILNTLRIPLPVLYCLRIREKRKNRINPRFYSGAEEILRAFNLLNSIVFRRI
jgi:hypothetical protein